MAKSKHEATLGDLAPGQSGFIVSVGNKRDAVKRRLVDMGLTPGTKITVVKAAPFGDPVEVRLRGYSLSLRKEDLLQIGIGKEMPGRAKDAAEKAASGALPHSGSEGRRAHFLKGEGDSAANERWGQEKPGEDPMQDGHWHERERHAKRYDSREHDRRTMRIALAGNPNSGKTTLYNALTGSTQYVGNWPGVTVEKKEGIAKLRQSEITVVDLPGVYSLSPYSMEEIVSRDYIIGTSSSPAPDAVINIVDATNLERNLYLTVQLLELEKPVVLALNFMDEARAAGDRIDAVALSAALGIPVVPIVAKTGENIEKLLETAHKQMHEGYTLEPDDLYDDFTHEIHHAISAVMHDNAYAAGLPAHWASIKLLEGDRIVKESLKLSAQQESEIEAVASEYEKAGGGLGDRETLVADSRYLYIENIVRASVRKGAQPGAQTLTEKIDRLATHKYLAVPLFLALMLLMFSLTFGAVGSFLSDMTAGAMEALSDLARGWLGAIGVAQWLQRLVCDGIAVGVGSVLSFLPQIAILFFFLSVLEDSGYMARAAFIMDRLLRRFGLSGKAFIPMLMGFGCSVPAIMGARTMENEKDRRMTILLVPFMSCSAKLPVYGLVASAFFGRWAGIAIFSLYIMGMAGGVLSGIFFKKYIFAGEPAAFVMELPPYRIPSAENTLRHVWERLRGFIARAGTIILLMSVLLWFLESFDSALQMTGDASKSLLAIFGGFLAPLFRPLGFGSWQASVAILTGLIAKEAVVASLSMFYGFDLTAAPADVAASMSGFTPLAAFALLVFVLLYVPCLAAVGALYKEMNSLKWTLFSVAWQIGFAYAASFLAFQLGSLLGFA